MKEFWKKGKNYFIRLVTHHYTGKLVDFNDKELLLIDVAWIADDGRFNTAIATETFNEVEPYPDGRQVILSRGAVLDACEIKKLPREVK